MGKVKFEIAFLLLGFRESRIAYNSSNL